LDDLADPDPEPDPTLEDGMELPQYYGKFPKELYWKPIKDPDRYYRENGKEVGV